MYPNGQTSSVNVTPCTFEQDAQRTQHESCGISTQNSQSDSNHEETSGQIKLRNFQQQSWLYTYKNVECHKIQSEELSQFRDRMQCVFLFAFYKGNHNDRLEK